MDHLRHHYFFCLLCRCFSPIQRLNPSMFFLGTPSLQSGGIRDVKTCNRLAPPTIAVPFHSNHRCRSRRHHHGRAKITTTKEAKKYYPLFGLGANVALIFSGQYVRFVSAFRASLPAHVDKWGVSLKLLMGE